jgi:hypothetical protein
MKTKTASKYLRAMALAATAVAFSAGCGSAMAMGSTSGFEPRSYRAGPHKMPNRFYHERKAREVAEFARLEAVDGTSESIERAPRRAPHKANNRFFYRQMQ